MKYEKSFLVGLDEFNLEISNDSTQDKGKTSRNI